MINAVLKIFNFLAELLANPVTLTNAVADLQVLRTLAVVAAGQVTTKKAGLAYVRIDRAFVHIWEPQELN